MGAAHVSAVYAQWSHLADRPFRVLAYMALIAKDATPEPTYWGGRDGLCIALGMAPDPVSYRIARRAVADLLAAGALERKYVGHAGKRSEYRVVVGTSKGDTTVPQPTPHDKGKGGQESPPEGGHLSPQRRTPESAKEDTSVPPRNTRSTRSEIEEEISSSQVSTDRAREEDATTGSLTPFEVQAILRDTTEDVPALMAQAPEACTTKAQRRAWVASQILMRESA